MRVATVTLQKLRPNCDEAFSKPKNRTLESFKFFSRKQKEKETLRQFWHMLTGLAAKCEFGDQTESLVMDTFIQNMNNEIVQERLCKNRITMHMPQLTSKILQIRLTANKNASLFQKRVKCFARYTV